MPTFAQAFHINKTQGELDFVNVSLSTDNPFFIDPFALAWRLDRWSHTCHLTLITFFQGVIDHIRSGRHDEARELLLHLREPNETRVGYSAHRPQGAGIGRLQAEELYAAFRDSAAVRTGFLASLEESELMIEGIGRDKISDLTTNIIRGELVEYTGDQCELHEVPRRSLPLPPCFDSSQMTWQSRYVSLPEWRGRPILLVPKAIVRHDPAYNHNRYYREFVLEFLQAENIAARSALVRTLKDGRQRVYKKDLQARFPCTKEFLYEFSRSHPDVLRRYRRALTRLEKTDRGSDVDPQDEPTISQALATAVQAIHPGTDQASQYHSLMVGLVEFLFFPKLLYPKKEQEIHEGRKRIDIVMDNGAHQGVFHYLPTVRRLPCAYVLFECKNYRTEVANPEIDQLSGRFSVNRGTLGFLCCRHFENRNLFIQRCRDTFRDGRGLILPLDDETMLRYLDLIRRRRRHALDRELSNLVAEVWLD